jgi:hypothetical protein
MNMPKYRVLEKSFINNSIVDEGKIIDFDDKPGSNLEPIDAQGEALAKSVPTGVDVTDLARQKVSAAAGDPDALLAAQAASAAAEAAQKVVQGGSMLTASASDLV